MQEYEQSVFISYAWGGESEEIVNQIDGALQQRGLKIIRDKRDLGYKGSISAFMERIGQGNCVIVVISDKYLRSPNCMFELVEIAEGKQFHDRVFPIVLSNAEIYDPVKRLQYVKHWEDKLAELDQAMRGVGQANLQGIREEIDQYSRIRDKVSGLTSIMKDMNTLTTAMHRDSDFSEIYTGIEKRMTEALSLLKRQTKSEEATPEINLFGFSLVSYKSLHGTTDAKRFYLGHLPTWGDLESDLDVRRSLRFNNESMNYSTFLNLLMESKTSNVVMVFGEGGAGKSTFIRRITYDLVKNGESVYRARPYANINAETFISSLRNADTQKLFFIIDDAHISALTIAILSQELKIYSPMSVLICASRKNEWNSATKNLRIENDTAILSRLSLDETDVLLETLAKHDLLGNLASKSLEERRDAFVYTDQQLLVTLLEATHGKRFKEIVIDEFNGIEDKEAQFAYLTLCLTMNLGLSLDEMAIAIITGVRSLVELKNRIMGALDLIVNSIRFRGKIQWVPRHKIIAKEVIEQLYPERERQLLIWQDVLKRLSRVDQPETSIQRFSARLLKNLDENPLIQSRSEAETMVQLCISAGVSQYWILTPEVERKQGIHPSQQQYCSAVELGRKYFSYRDNVRLINEGLEIDATWNNLKVLRAMLEAEFDNVDEANEIVEEILNDVATGDQHKFYLPMGLAVRLAKFREEQGDDDSALKYLQSASKDIHLGMIDDSGYFISISKLYLRFGDQKSAKLVLRQGVFNVISPEKMVKRILYDYENLLVRYFSDELPEWINEKYNGIIPNHLNRLVLYSAVMRHDADLTKKTIESIENFTNEIIYIINDRNLRWDIRRFSFLFNCLQDMGKKIALPKDTVKRLIHKVLNEKDFRLAETVLLKAKDLNKYFEEIADGFSENMSVKEFLVNFEAAHPKLFLPHTQKVERSPLLDINASQPISNIALEIAGRLHETESAALNAIERGLRLMGNDFIAALVDEAILIDSSGGMMVSNKSRRRTLGGVFFYLLRKKTGKKWHLIHSSQELS